MATSSSFNECIGMCERFGHFLIRFARLIERLFRLNVSATCALTIGLFYIAKIRFPEIWQRMRFVGVFRLHGKGHKKSKSLHSALGKISVVNLMYNLLGLKNY